MTAQTEERLYKAGLVFVAASFGLFFWIVLSSFDWWPF